MMTVNNQKRALGLLCGLSASTACFNVEPTGNASASIGTGSTGDATTASATTTTSVAPGTETDMGTTTGAATQSTDADSTATQSTSDGSSTGVVAECGNGVLDKAEQCDGTDFGTADCQEQGFVAGDLACTAQCVLDVSACLDQLCGNDVVEGDEVCDGTDLAGENCVSQGATAGELACAADCTLDLSACQTCGNDTIEGTEVCDGSDLGGESCASLGLEPGMLGCAADCSTVATALCGGPQFILTERNSQNIWQWDPSGMTSLFHTADANDVDCNPAQGSNDGWIPWHSGDYWGPFTPGVGMGVNVQYATPYAYPKHITVFNGEIVVMSRNDATLHWYSTAGVEQGLLATGNGTGQGMATDGTDLYASFWNGANSFFVRYNSAFVFQEMIANPMGLGANVNVFDFAYDSSSGTFYGIVTNSEGGTGTQSNTVVEFGMGGAVLATYNVAFFADGIGQQDCL